MKRLKNYKLSDRRLKGIIYQTYKTSDKSCPTLHVQQVGVGGWEGGRAIMGALSKLLRNNSFTVAALD